MYLWNTEDLYIDWWELSWDWRNVWLRDDAIYDTSDIDILEDNIDMLPSKIYHDYEEYLCLIDIVDEGEWLLWRLSYITSYGKILFEIFSDSYIDIVKLFNNRKESVLYPQEIRYIY